MRAERPSLHLSSCTLIAVPTVFTPGDTVWYDARPFRLRYELVIGVWMATPLFVEMPDEPISIEKCRRAFIHGF